MSGLPCHGSAAADSCYQDAGGEPAHARGAVVTHEPPAQHEAEVQALPAGKAAASSLHEHAALGKALLRGAAQGACGGATVFLAALLAARDAGVAEDVVDLLHAASTFSLAATACRTTKLGVEGTGLEAGEVRMLAPWAERRAAAMFRMSLGFFWADAAYVVTARAAGHRPHQWAERLLHHALQSVANLSCLVPGPGLRARLCFLAFAYLAEGSSVPLRLTSLARRVAAPAVILRRLRVATLAVFTLVRVVNGPWSMYLIWAARRHLAPSILRLQLTFGGVAYAMNCAWFLQLLWRLPGATHLQRPRGQGPPALPTMG